MMILQRREFITLLGGAAAWPLPARAQQDNRVRRVGGLMAGDENDPESERRVLAFKQALADLGWSNVRMDLRWPGGDINRIDTCILRWVTLANINVAKVPILP